VTRRDILATALLGGIHYPHIITDIFAESRKVSKRKIEATLDPRAVRRPGDETSVDSNPDGCGDRCPYDRNSLVLIDDSDPLSSVEESREPALPARFSFVEDANSAKLATFNDAGLDESRRLVGSAVLVGAC